MAKRDTDADAMPLQKLIVERMRSKGWDPPQVEDRGISHSTLHAYLSGRPLKTMPRDTTITALATALDLSEDEVRTAAWLSIPANKSIRGNLTLQGSGEVQPATVGAVDNAGPIAEREPSLRDASLDELLAEVARRARGDNPEAR